MPPFKLRNPSANSVGAAFAVGIGVAVAMGLPILKALLIGAGVGLAVYAAWRRRDR